MSNTPSDVVCAGLAKRFVQVRKSPGLLGSFRSLFHREEIPIDAVSDFSLTIKPGEFVGLLGPNGAGKTTLMKMFSGLVAPTSGSLRVLGEEPFQRSMGFRRAISLVMGQKSQLWPDIPALDSFELLQSYYDIPQNRFKDRLQELAHLLGLEKLLEIQLRRLSLGERMKMELMACLLHEPRILFLDEPTIGLDVVAQQRIREFLLNYQTTRGITIILTSHYMADIEALCDRVVLILGGRKRFDGEIHQFEHILGHEKYVAVQFTEPQLDQTVDGALSHFDPTWSEDRLRVELRIPETELRSAMRSLLEKYPVADISTERMPIERVMHSVLSNPHLLPEGLP